VHIVAVRRLLPRSVARSVCSISSFLQAQFLDGILNMYAWEGKRDRQMRHDVFGSLEKAFGFSADFAR
jgi:hypothetical protein